MLIAVLIVTIFNILFTLMLMASVGNLINTVKKMPGILAKAIRSVYP